MILRLFFPALGFAVLGASEVPMTLELAITTSQRENPDVAVAAARVQEAQARMRQANAAFLPRVSLASNYTLTDQPAMAFMGLINHGAYTPMIDPNKPPTVDNLNLGATVQIPFYTPGAWSARSAAKHDAAATQHAKDATLSALTMTTVQAFISVHQAQAHVLAADALLISAEKNLNTARDRHQAGTLSKAELLGLEAQHAAARSHVAAAKGGLDLAGQALASVLGREGSITSLAAMPAISAPGEDVMGEKPELNAIRSQTAAAQAQVEQAQAQHLPRIGAFGGYGYDKGFRQDGDGRSWYVGVGVEWTIFAGGSTEAGIAQAEAGLAAARAQLRSTALAIQQGRAAARTRYTTIAEQLTAAKAQCSAAEESARLQAERFAVGSATALDLAMAEANLAQARAALADTQAGERMSITDLRWQYGLPILP